MAARASSTFGCSAAMSLPDSATSLDVVHMPRKWQWLSCPPLPAASPRGIRTSRRAATNLSLPSSAVHQRPGLRAASGASSARIHAAATPRSLRMFGGRRGHAPWVILVPSMRLRRFRSHRSSVAIEDVLTVRLEGVARTIHANATPRPLRMSGGHQGSSAVRLRDIPATVHAAATLPSPPISVADKNCSPRASGTSSGSSARRRRPIHLARPVPMTTCSPAAFGTASGASARVFTGVTATSSV